MLSEVQESVERLYCNGTPLHHLEAARSTAYNPSDPRTSSVFVVDAPTFRQMDAKTIQGVFQQRHILVTGVESEEMVFDLVGLSTLGCPEVTRSVQGK